MKKYLFWLMLAVLIWVIPFVHADEHSAEILWDEWGVPHIYAPDNESLFYAFGWAQAHNHGDLLMRLYAQARGEASALGGEDYLEDDQLTRTLGIPQEGDAGYNAAPEEFRRYVDAFAAGMTDYVRANPDAIDDTWESVIPITGADILRHGARSLRYNFLAGGGISAATDWQDESPESGSNAWAIAPSRSASGNAMLVANPHQPWFDMGLWIEAHFITPDLNLYGAALMGSPTINIGFNEHLGWTHTVNTHDGWDLYELTLSDDGYVYDGEVLPFETREETIQVKQADGTLREESLTVQKSVHGVILAQNEDSALALRVVGDNSYLSGWQWWQMGNSTNLDEFQAALEPLAIPMFTIMYADTDGNIMHVFNEQIPVRSEGDWAFWNNTTPVDDSHPALIPGDSSAYLWTTFHPFADLPKVINPPTGWLQNANEPPWLTTLPPVLNPEDFPPYFAPRPFVWPRPTRSMKILSGDESITFEELQAYKYDTRMELADEVLDDLVAAAQDSESEIVQQAATILNAWDRHADKDSVGAALFTLWAVNYLQEVGVSAYAVQFDANDPLNTPRGLADPAGAVLALEASARTLEATRLFGGGMDVPYGDAFRLRYMDSEVDLPASGGFDVVGTFSILTFIQDTDLRFYPVHGDSFIAVIEFGDPIRAKVLLSYGNSSQPGSPHVGDQLQFLSDRSYRDALITREQVEAHLERSETVTMP
jgi:acyl-homoserine-lactone acylase